MKNNSCYVRILSVDPFPGTFFGKNLSYDPEWGCYVLEHQSSEGVNIWKLFAHAESYGWKFEDLNIAPDLWEAYDYVICGNIYSLEK